MVARPIFWLTAASRSALVRSRSVLVSEGVRGRPGRSGWRRLVSLVLVAMYEAQLTDARRRLKVCRNPRCRCAFYDRSRNNSGVWHDVKRCGNPANLRAYRARQRVQDKTAGAR